MSSQITVCSRDRKARWQCAEYEPATIQASPRVTWSECGLYVLWVDSMARMAYDPDNIFAKILRGEANAHVVLDEEHCLAFMDLMPQSPGHTLVIPKEPAENLFDLSSESLGRLMASTQRVAVAVKAAMKPAGMMIAQLNGRDAGQTVFHIHFHVIPRYPGDGLTLHARSIADADELAANAAKIRAALA